MKINFTDKKPNEAGWYVANFASSGLEMIHIVSSGGELINVNGARTHFSRWLCSWSEKVEENR